MLSRVRRKVDWRGTEQRAARTSSFDFSIRCASLPMGTPGEKMKITEHGEIRAARPHPHGPFLIAMQELSGSLKLGKIHAH